MLAYLPISPTALAGQVRPSTLALYTHDALAYAAFAGSADAAQNPATLLAWRQHLVRTTRYSPHTINRMLSSVRAVMRTAFDVGAISDVQHAGFAAVSPVRVRALKERVHPHRKTLITREQMHDLCAAPDLTTLRGIRDRAILLTLATSGVRAGELCALQPTQIATVPGGYLLRVVGKEDIEPRAAPLAPIAHDAIGAWLACRTVTSPYIFTSFAGRGALRLSAKPMSTSALWQVVQAYAGLVGLSHIKPHDFRRYVGTQLAATNVRTAQLALGHASIQITERHYLLDQLVAGTTDSLVAS